MSHVSRLAAPIGFVLLSVWAGCASTSTASGGNDVAEDLGTEASALVEAAVEADDTDKDAEDGIETPLSGVTDTATGDVSVDDDKEGASGKAEKNGRGFFRPAGCLKSTREGAVVTHVFDNCTGPRGLLSMTGTVVSTWSKGPGSLSVEHKTTGFKVNGATITQTVTISHAMAGGVLTRTRTGTMTGTTAKGRTIEHKVNFVTTRDSATKCLTRNGTATTTVGTVTFERTVTNWVRCGGEDACPRSGEAKVKGPKGAVDMVVSAGKTLELKSGGKSKKRELSCKEN